MPTINYPGVPGTVLYAGKPTPSGGVLLTTLTLQNTSSTEQAAGFVSPMFGQPFKQGDVPSGQYPQFELTDGTPCPATIHSVTSWPDGSMKWCGVLLRVPSSIAGSGSLTINVKNGGSAPGSSARAVTDSNTANLFVELTGVTNLSGAWTSAIIDGIATGTTVQIADGPAGAIWRVLADFKQAGTPHGQLVCWHYLASLQNSSGGLYGIRYLGRVAQPWADVSTPTPTRRVMSARLVSGSTTVRNMQGYDTTETLGSNIGMPHYSSWFTAGTDGKWDYFQSGGSAAADCTVRVQHDKAYFISSRLVSPYDTTINPASSPTQEYFAYGRAGMLRAMETGGDREDIGVFTAWAARHLLTQSATDEQVIRAVGMCSSGWRTAIRKQSTKQVVACVDNSASYTGLGAIETSWWYRAVGGANTGLQTPTDTTSLWSFEFEPSHRPAATYYPYIVTGEPQYLDLLMEQSTELLLNKIPGNYTMVTVQPITTYITAVNGNRDIKVGSTTFKGAGPIFGSFGIRIAAWGTRDISDAAAIYPDVCPDGTEVRKYLREVAKSYFDMTAAYFAAMPSTFQNTGMYLSREEGGVNSYEQPWQTQYLAESVCHQSAILATSESAAMRQHMAKNFVSLHATSDIALAASPWASAFNESGQAVMSETQMLYRAQSVLTFEATGNTFTISGNPSAGGRFGGWTLTNGDMIAFSSVLNAYKPFAEATDNRRLYVVNASGGTGQLALTPGGAPITVTNPGSVNSFMLRAATFAPNYSSAETTDYVRRLYGVLRFHEAMGDTTVNPARLAQDQNFIESGASFTADPKNGLAPSFAG